MRFFNPFLRRLAALLCLFLITWAKTMPAHAGDCQSNTLPPTVLNFIENKGQWNDIIKYKVELNSARLFLEQNRLTYVLVSPDDIDAIHEAHHTPDSEDILVNCHAFRVNFENANTNVMPAATCLTEPYRNYFIGKKDKWRSHVGLYQQIDYTELWNGVTMRIYGDDATMKYDFIVKPNANIDQIKLSYDGLDKLFVKDGNLHAVTSVNTLIDQKPFAYQYIDGKMVEVPCNFIVSGNKVSFDFPSGYNPNAELIIDPTLVFSTYTGSTADNWGFTAAYDFEGHLFAGGVVFDIGYPTTIGAFQESFQGGSSGSYFPADMGITKYTPDGTGLVYSTYVGGSLGNEVPHSIVIDDQGDLIIYGTSASTDFPTSPDCYDDSHNGGAEISINSVHYIEGTDIVIAKISSDGASLLAGTFIGGIGNDGINTVTPLKFNYADEHRGEVFFDKDGNIYIASTTQSPDFPASPGSFQEYSNGSQEGVVLKFNPDLSELMWGTHIGGTKDDAVYSVKPYPDGTIYICGGTTSKDFPTTAGTLFPSAIGGTADAFVAHINKDGSQLLQSTYLGTTSYDQSYFIETDADGYIYTVGQTQGAYPKVGDVYNIDGGGQYIHKLSPQLDATIFSMAFGNGDGTPDISPTAFLVDKCNQIYVSGWGSAGVGGVSNLSTLGLPVTSDAYQSTTDGNDFYFIVFSQDCKDIAFATFFGAPSGTGEHVDGGTSRFSKDGVVYQAVCAGCGGSDLFPTTPGAWSETNNSTNCNLGSIKFAFELTPVIADFVTTEEIEACKSIKVFYKNKSLNADQFTWYFDDGTTSKENDPVKLYDKPGKYLAYLVAEKTGTCNGIDTAFYNVTVYHNPVLTVKDVDCIPNAKNATFTIDVVGEDETFTLSGGVNAQLKNGESLTLELPGDGSTVLVNAIGNDSGCTGSLSFNLPVCNPCPDNLIDLIAGPECVAGTENFSVTFEIFGEEEEYQLSGDALGIFNTGDKPSFEFKGDGKGQYTVVCTGLLTGCVEEISFNAPLCCITNLAGPTPVEPVCAGATGTTAATDVVLGEGQQVVYVLHSNSLDPLGSILAINTTGEFTYDAIKDEGAKYYTTYYITAYAAKTTPNGSPDLSDPCYDSAGPVEIVFLAPVELTVNGTCDWSTGDYTVVLSAKGGYPQWDANSQYNISGDLIYQPFYGETLPSLFFKEGEKSSYMLILSDPYGCPGDNFVEDIICEKTPLELLNFNATQQEKGVLLQFSVAAQINNQYFTLYYSANGQQFEPFTTIQGAGTANEVYAYSALHTPPSLCGTAYYRLSWTDANGYTQYSNIVAVNLGNKENIQPNIVLNSNHDVAYLNLPETFANGHLRVYDTQGRMVANQTINAATNGCQLTQSINLQNWSNYGLYFVQLRNATGQQTHTFKLIR